MTKHTLEYLYVQFCPHTCVAAFGFEVLSGLMSRLRRSRSIESWTPVTLGGGGRRVFFQVSSGLLEAASAPSAVRPAESVCRAIITVYCTVELCIHY